VGHDGGLLKFRELELVASGGRPQFGLSKAGVFMGAVAAGHGRAKALLQDQRWGPFRKTEWRGTGALGRLQVFYIASSP
jgi:hypothetical protein